MLSHTVAVQIIVSCTKGILNDTLETVNQILTRVVPEPLHKRLAYLSGPSFAAEVWHCCLSVHLLLGTHKILRYFSSSAPFGDHTRSKDWQPPHCWRISMPVREMYHQLCTAWSDNSRNPRLVSVPHVLMSRVHHIIAHIS